ncbi:phospholipase/carboxylesterase [Salinimicrobium catena]|uniref:Phospholipase/carboxylesterase n=1 Tax=Salinimicrobium catena TaxID=390640 RepID=A0A1H5LWC3_9FLAO|nr:alpha/beta fold hydrolase [Salinimicrobium catena]SDL15272.1 phospholipase/carboxylesterase [Salinimicrobium catena]SEE81250.1 phospholipase/carboxylesterase [Salinimicrobium catena]
MNTSTLSLYHLVRKPKIAVEKAPLLIMMHGYGSNEEDLFSFAEELPDELFIISLRAPYPMPPYGHAWYAIHWDNNDGKFSDDVQAVTSREKIAEFIDEAIEQYPVDPTNVSLLGFSQGCILSLAVALSYPEKVKNVIGLSGYVNPDILKEGFRNNDFSNLSVYSSHGTQDQVIPVSWARNTKPFLDSLKIENSYSEFPVGHGVAPQNFWELKKWLEERL